MAGLLRLIAVFAIAVSAFGVARADIPLSYTWNSSQTGTGGYPSAAAACIAGWAHAEAGQSAFRYGHVSVQMLSSGRSAICRGRRTTVSSGAVADVSATADAVGAGFCVANSERVGDVCVCKPGFVQTDGANGPQCQAPPAGEKWKKWCRDVGGKEIGFYEAPGRGITAGCYGPISNTDYPEVPMPDYRQGDVSEGGGCKIGLTNTRSFPNADGTYYTQGDAVFTGGTCTVGDVPGDAPEETTKEPQAEPAKCVGGYSGTVGGTEVCAKPDPSSGVDWAGTKKTTSADGTEVTKETKTTCAGDTCKTETKTTTKDATGTTTGTTTETTSENKGTLCARDPGNGVCESSATNGKATTGNGGGGGGGSGQGGESSFAGNCASGFVAVSDDAVTNAMAREQHTRNCQLLNTEGAEQTEVNAEMQKDKTNVTGDNPNNAEVNMTNRIDTSDALGGGSCELNRDLVVQGFTVTLPFNNLCGSLGMLGNLLVAVAMLLAGRIITRG